MCVYLDVEDDIPSTDFIIGIALIRLLQNHCFEMEMCKCTSTGILI